MGVHGLWRLLDATGKPVALETLEGKVLAVDVSIWLHQVMQGYQDGRGNPLPNAHLLGLFNRICKLLYYKIKPVFVFDGGVPLLKKNTIASRRKQKNVAANKAQKMKTDLINNLLKRTVVKGALGAGHAEKQEEVIEGISMLQVDRSSVRTSLDLFKLPAIPSSSGALLSSDEDDPSSDTDSSVLLSPRKQARWIGNIHSVDVSSAEFRALPPDVRHDILTDLKATRKENSWGRLHEMPEESHDFSNYQMKRLLKRRNVQECLEEAEKEMGGKTMTLEELDTLLTEQGISTTTKDNASRIAADNSTRFVYIQGEKKEVPQKKLRLISSTDSEENDNGDDKEVKILENLREYELDDDWEDDWESEDEQEVTVMKTTKFKKLMNAADVNPAIAYMLEHSGLSQEEILCIIEQNKNKKKESTNQNSKSDALWEQANLSNDSKVAIKSEACDTSNDISVLKEVKSSPSVNSPVTLLNCDSNACVNSNLASNDDSLSEDDTNDVKIIPEVFTENETPVDDSRIEVSREEELSLAEKVVEKVPASNETSTIDSRIEVPMTEKSPLPPTSESDSDDFVEVGETSLLVTTSLVKKEEKQSLEIAIVPELPLEEDMFADIFSNNDELVVTELPVTPEKTEYKTEKKEVAVVSPKQSEDIQIPRIEPEESLVKNLTEEAEIKGGKEKEIMNIPVQRDELLSMQAELENEERQLSGDLGRLERQATDITDQMRLEAQELLRFFGIPYLIAPMEAEAQCAYLETINLTDGTITDDSDIWLFGGRCVYKNFFNHNKHVLQFRSVDIRHHFKLTREQMIQLALLVGSDYTIGVTGIGPVTALEILAAFPAEQGNLLRGLINFRCWINSGRVASSGRAALRTKLKNIHVEKGFPSEAVAQAYLTPTVDESKEGFTWNKPNATLLADFTREKFGWTKNKFDLIFNPIIKRLTEPKKQKGIDSYFGVKVSQKSIEGALSKRVQKAVERLGGDRADSDDDVEVPENPKQKKSRAKKLAAVSEPAVEHELETAADTKVAEDSKETPCPSKPLVAVASEFIPQREKDKLNALKRKLKAIEVFRKSKKGPGYTKRTKRSTRRIKAQAELSESSDSS